jgi:hypothetical protein
MWLAGGRPLLLRRGKSTAFFVDDAFTGLRPAPIEAQ